MTHNSDFAKGFIGLIGNQKAIGETFQITSDESLTWNQIYKTIAKLLNVEFKPYYVSSRFLADASNYDYEGGLIGDKANTVVFDNSKLKSVVPDFESTVSFEEGVKKTIENVLSKKELQIEDPEFDKWCDRLIDILEKAKKEIKESVQ